MKKAGGGVLIIAGLIAVGAFAILVTLRLNKPEEPLPVLASVPPFTLMESAGKEIGSEDLSGEAYVVDLIFTHCASICPRMTAEMSRLEKQTRDLPDLRFVSVSVDPERDTPAVLDAYAQRVGANRDRWYFLTGEKTEIWRLASDGFLLPLLEGKPELGDDEIIHSQYFVLVDGNAAIRGVYDFRDSEAMLRLRGDLRRLDIEDS